MKILKVFLLMLFALSMFSCEGCNPSNINLAPVIWTGWGTTGSRTTGAAHVDGTLPNKKEEAQAASVIPMVNGWTSGSYSVGDSFSSPFLGENVVTTISRKGGDIVFTGTNSEVYYQIILNQATKIFSYTQTSLVVITNFGGSGLDNYTLVHSDMSGAKISGTYFTGSGTVYTFEKNVVGTEWSHHYIRADYTCSLDMGNLKVTITSYGNLDLPGLPNEDIVYENWETYRDLYASSVVMSPIPPNTMYAILSGGVWTIVKPPAP